MLEKIGHAANTVIAACAVVALFAALWNLKVLERQLQEAKEISHLDQRAWVATVEVNDFLFAKTNGRFHVAVKIKNSGKTFAKNVKVEGKAVAHFQQPASCGNIGIPSDWFSSPGFLPPNGEYTNDLNWYICEGGEDVIRSEPYEVFVSGKITYTDVFNCSHWTSFCYFQGWDKKFGCCPTGNDADEDHCP